MKREIKGERRNEKVCSFSCGSNSPGDNPSTRKRAVASGRLNMFPIFTPDQEAPSCVPKN